MDISRLQLPPRSSHKSGGIRYLFTPESSVNVSYESASVDTGDSSRRDSVGPGDRPLSERSVSVTTLNSSADDDELNLEFVGTAVEQESTQFLRSLQEPKYAKALTGTEISWLFQEFYRQLRTKLEAEMPTGAHDTPNGELPMLSRDELAQRRRRRQRQARCIEHALDSAEIIVTSQLSAKLFDIADQERDQDRRLQQRIDALRQHPELRSRLWDHLGLRFSDLDFLSRASQLLTDLGRERTPQAKLTLLVRANKAVAEALDAAGAAGADAVLPAFVAAVVSSELTRLWRTLLYVRRFRRSESQGGHAAYCLTNLDAALQIIESLVFAEVPEGVDPALFASPLARSRSRSSSASSRLSGSGGGSGSSTNGGGALGLLSSFGSSYRNLVSRLGGPVPGASLDPSSESSDNMPYICERFMTADADTLTISEVRTLLAEYRRLATHARRHL